MRTTCFEIYFNPVYLYVRSLAEVMGFTSGLILKTPLAIFWYSDFKSIGDNSAYLYNMKAPISLNINPQIK